MRFGDVLLIGDVPHRDYLVRFGCAAEFVRAYPTDTPTRTAIYKLLTQYRLPPANFKTYALPAVGVRNLPSACQQYLVVRAPAQRGCVACHRCDACNACSVRPVSAVRDVCSERPDACSVRSDACSVPSQHCARQHRQGEAPTWAAWPASSVL